MRDQIAVVCLPLKQVTMVRIHFSQPAGEPAVVDRTPNPEARVQLPTPVPDVVAKWPKATVCKTVIGGSNPPHVSSVVRIVAIAVGCKPTALTGYAGSSPARRTSVSGETVNTHDSESCASQLEGSTPSSRTSLRSTTGSATDS